jgi:hypothetical protein
LAKKAAELEAAMGRRRGICNGKRRGINLQWNATATYKQDAHGAHKNNGPP